MDVSIIETPSLGDRSYLVSEAGTAVVIDPQRDVDRVLSLADDLGVRITHTLETHIHNDYVTGGLELSRTAGAQYVVPGSDALGYDRRAVDDGDIIDAGPIQLQVMHTPGHTHHHVSYILRDCTGTTVGVFTGGSMLFGTTGRTDLVGQEHTLELTHAQYHSVNRLAAELPADTEVYPTHGFGSFCAATPAKGHFSALGQQQHSNPALTQDEQSYVDQLLAGLGAYPAYYAHMGVINRNGPRPVDLSLPKPVDPEELRRRIKADKWVVDLRERTAFAAAHLGGTIGFELSGSFATYLGWLYEWGAPLTLIGEDVDQIANARRELVRIGIDDLAGAAVGEIHTLVDGTEPRSYRVAHFHALADALDDLDVQVLDVRQEAEYAASHIYGAVNIPLHQLAQRAADVPTGTVWIHCGSGYRASIAASMIDRFQPTVVLVNDQFANAQALGLAK
jgi:glyoxylase-like metal-dependent hydrolase (beta-lactamase superfamily II)/rhodanese-related sulfurtransferase